MSEVTPTPEPNSVEEHLSEQLETALDLLDKIDQLLDTVSVPNDPSWDVTDRVKHLLTCWAQSVPLYGSPPAASPEPTAPVPELAPAEQDQALDHALRNASNLRDMLHLGLECLNAVGLSELRLQLLGLLGAFDWMVVRHQRLRHIESLCVTPPVAAPPYTYADEVRDVARVVAEENADLGALAGTTLGSEPGVSGAAPYLDDGVDYCS